MSLVLINNFPYQLGRHSWLLNLPIFSDSFVRKCILYTFSRSLIKDQYALFTSSSVVMSDQSKLATPSRKHLLPFELRFPLGLLLPLKHFHKLSACLVGVLLLLASGLQQLLHLNIHHRWQPLHILCVKQVALCLSCSPKWTGSITTEAGETARAPCGDAVVHVKRGGRN